jgi:predicted XRE-type DNA-binding protein
MTREVWKSLSHINKDYYISNYGIVKSTKYCTRTKTSERILKSRLRPDGYCDVGLCVNGKVKLFLIHRLVLYAFVGPEPFCGAVTRHLDGIRSNNFLENLKWGTHKENRQDRRRHNTWSTGNNYGENAGGVKLNNKQVKIIKYLLRDKKLTQKEISDVFGVQRECITKIKNGIRWRHIK